MKRPERTFKTGSTRFLKRVHGPHSFPETGAPGLRVPTESKALGSEVVAMGPQVDKKAHHDHA
ncbi:MAG: hypothetical protein JWP91_3818 [Fibrobacteres bacterium]|nr:hypothetical protein [Fibrobacterota bacterium]